jgi:hypothetical protein
MRRSAGRIGNPSYKTRIGNLSYRPVIRSPSYGFRDLTANASRFI